MYSRTDIKVLNFKNVMFMPVLAKLAYSIEQEYLVAIHRQKSQNDRDIQLLDICWHDYKWKERKSKIKTVIENAIGDRSKEIYTPKSICQQWAKYEIA